MNFQMPVIELLPVLPELILAIGAMALLLIGAYERRAHHRTGHDAGASPC